MILMCRTLLLLPARGILGELHLLNGGNNVLEAGDHLFDFSEILLDDALQVEDLGHFA